MNFNANSGTKQHLGRKLKRVSDVNAMGYNPYSQQSTSFPGNQDINNMNSHPQGFPQQPVSGYTPQPLARSFEAPKDIPYNVGLQPNSFGNNQNSYNAPGNPSMAMFSQPLVQDIALQYGQQLANIGTTTVKKEIERFVPVSRLKYYFAVDTRYVLSKLKLLFFPFTHRDWSIKYEQDGGPVQPRYEINAPDLYIPTMAYITYVLIASLVLGMQQRFSPEQIGIQASSALAWCLFELVIYSCTLYIANIETSLRTLDLLAYSGYKFVGIITSILFSLLGTRGAYYAALAYTNFALAFYLVRTLRVKVLPETNTQSYYGDQPTSGNKRRLYFLLFIAGIQPLLSWWLSFHLLSPSL